MQVILNRPKHNIMSWGPRGSALDLPTATQLLCSQDGSIMLSLRALTTLKVKHEASLRGEKKKCSDTHIFPGDKSNQVLPQQGAKLSRTSCNHYQILPLNCPEPEKRTPGQVFIRMKQRWDYQENKQSFWWRMFPTVYPRRVVFGP